MQKLRINNTILEKLKKFKLNKSKSRSITLRVSERAKHIKKPKYVKEALRDLEENHNHSWYKEIHDRVKDDMDKIAILYRGNEITYKALFDNADVMAKSLEEYEIKRGDEIPVCMSNTPELIMLLLAISKIGAKANIFGEDFAKEYIREIISGTSHKLFFATDDLYEEVKDIVEEFSFTNKVIFSLADSLPNGIDPYAAWDSKYKEFTNKVYTYQKEDKTIINRDKFLEIGELSSCIIIDKGRLNDEFTITYSSGSTKKGRPKAIIHTNRSYIAMGRFHDKDLSRLPETKDLIVLAHIPPHSNTNLMTCISDTLTQKCTVAVEPIYDKDFFLKSLLINKPNFAPATRSFYLHLAKTYDKEFSNVKLPFLVLPTSVGEAISVNEEKFINKSLKKMQTGTKLPKGLSPVSLSIGGGDCEHGGLFFTMWKGLREKLVRATLRKENYGLVPFQHATCAVLRKDGSECAVNEIGRLTATSSSNMKGYKNDPAATNKFFMTDSYGNVRGDCNVWSFIDKRGNVHMKGRIGNEIKLSTKEEVPTFVVADAILKDTKNILACEVVNVKNEEGIDTPIAHVEMLPDKIGNSAKTIISADKRIKALLEEELAERVLYRIHTNDEGFILTGCGKRSVLALEEEGISRKCFKPNIKEEKKMAVKVLAKRI